MTKPKPCPICGICILEHNKLKERVRTLEECNHDLSEDVEDLTAAIKAMREDA